MLEDLLPYLSKQWMVTLREIAPLIGIVVLAIIVLAIVLFTVWWYRYWVKRGMKEYEKEHLRRRLKSTFDFKVKRRLQSLVPLSQGR